VGARFRRINLMIPIGDGENPPSARHWCGDALRDPRRRLKGLPSATRMITAKAENQMDA
jgi:hypothetical protein